VRLPLFIPVIRNTFLARLLCHGDAAGLHLRADGRLEVERSDGTRAEADVDASTTVFVSLIVLRYRAGGRPNSLESLVLPSAAVGKDAHRRLRVWLRCRAKTGVSAAA